MTTRPGLDSTLTRLRTQVVDGADGRCQCTGQCGRSHRKGHGRCHVLDTEPHWLILAPASGADRAARAARVPASELHAWCPGCLDRVDLRTRTTRAAAQADEQCDLFDATHQWSNGVTPQGIRKAS